MYKTLAALGVAAAVLFAAPQGASALPGQGTGVNSATSDIVQVGHKHRHYKHRKWRRGDGHHNHRRYYRKRARIGVHFN
jgi:hypothetical protein